MFCTDSGQIQTIWKAETFMWKCPFQVTLFILNIDFAQPFHWCIVAGFLRPSLKVFRLHRFPLRAVAKWSQLFWTPLQWKATTKVEDFKPFRHSLKLPFGSCLCDCGYLAKLSPPVASRQTAMQNRFSWFLPCPSLKVFRFPLVFLHGGFSESSSRAGYLQAFCTWRFGNQTPLKVLDFFHREEQPASNKTLDDFQPCSWGLRVKLPLARCLFYCEGISPFALAHLVALCWGSLAFQHPCFLLKFLCVAAPLQDAPFHWPILAHLGTYCLTIPSLWNPCPLAANLQRYLPWKCLGQPRAANKTVEDFQLCGTVASGCNLPVELPAARCLFHCPGVPKAILRRVVCERQFSVKRRF